MVLDSLRHWALAYHVDGFRFDLGSTLGREPGGFDPGSGFFDAICQDPVLSRLKLISEPWDIGPGGYQLGNHPPPFAEWNDRFRDTIRRFVRGDPGQRAELAARLSGSGDLLGNRRRKSWASINFVAAHDGFTLHDLASYAERHNEANGEENRDGHGENLSANWGAEGPTDDAGILDQRERVKRFLLSLVMYADGTPMLLAGDEMGRTQLGNNNAYCQDNTLSWLDWTPSDAGRSLAGFTARLVAARREWAALQGGDFMHGRHMPRPGLPDIAWFDEQAQPLSEEDWQDPEARLLAVQRARAHADGTVGVTLLLMNATGEDREFQLPADQAWQLVTDSADPAAGRRDAGDSVVVGHHGAVLLGAVVP
jgi:glycogen operon protein